MVKSYKDKTHLQLTPPAKFIKISYLCILEIAKSEKPVGKFVVNFLEILFQLMFFFNFSFLTIFINIKLLKSSKDLDSIKEKKVVLPKKSQDVLDKKGILTTTDLILKKYTKKSEL